MNNNSELTLDELDHAAGGNIVDIITGPFKAVELMSHVSDHTPTNIANANVRL